MVLRGLDMTTALPSDGAESSMRHEAFGSFQVISRSIAHLEESEQGSTMH